VATLQSVALPSSRSWQAGLPGRSSIVELVAEQLMERQIPIASAIETLAKRLGATNEQAWAEIKSSAFYGRLSLAGIDDKGRLCDLEPHWIRYISPWGVEDPSPDGGSTAGATTSDMPRHGDFIAFDRERAIRHWRADKREGRTPRSIPPIRMRDVVADAAELDVRWMRAEYEFQSLDWSLGNALSWIAYRDALLICAFETQRDLARKRFYSFPRSDVPRRGMVLPMTDQSLLVALKEGTITAIQNGASVPSTFWFGRQSRDLDANLRFRRAEVIRCWPPQEEAAEMTPAEQLTSKPDGNRLVRRPPSREKPFWEEVRAVAREWLKENGCPAPNDGHQAELEKHVTEWLEDHDHEASESTLRRRVASWIVEYRTELGG
jgi:hypothetical protein